MAGGGDPDTPSCPRCDNVMDNMDIRFAICGLRDGTHIRSRDSWLYRDSGTTVRAATQTPPE